MDEIWKPVKGYEIYEVSDQGRVRSLKRVVHYCDGRTFTYEEKILKTWVGKNGYVLIGLSKEKKTKCFLVHRLVYESFVGEIPKKMDINHKDENKTNNVLTNLEVLSRRDNLNYGSHNARMAAAKIGVYNKGRSKPVGQYSFSGELIQVWSSVSEAGRNGFLTGKISDCCLGRRKTHHGYRWAYIQKEEAV